jgi:hypothetical protein
MDLREIGCEGVAHSKMDLQEIECEGVAQDRV